MRTNTNQLDFYNEQRDEFSDYERERRRVLANNGKLREDMRKRYPKASER